LAQLLFTPLYRLNLISSYYNEKYDRITEEMEELSQEPSAFIKVEFKQKDALSKVR
jgi:hypothetical protein